MLLRSLQGRNRISLHRLMSRLISCSSIVTLSMVFLKSRNSQRVCRALLRTGSDQPSLFTCPDLLFERSQVVVITVIDQKHFAEFVGCVYNDYRLLSC